MKRRLFLASLGAMSLTAASAFFFWPAALEPVEASASQPSGKALVERGRYLATAADCVACHTAPGGKPFAGGLAFKLPFGTILSSNITPDRQTGIGSYTDAEFVRAMRHGVRQDGKELYPAFPYPSYTLMHTDDVLAIRAWLNSLPPVRHKVEANGLSFPFNQRWLMRGWKLLFFRDRRFKAEARQTKEWNRGGYLVEALGHCGECHTPRNFLFGLRSDEKFAGEVTQGWNAYNITSDRRYGIGNWSVEEVTAYLSLGHAEGRGVASGKMAEAVEMSLSRLPPEDIRAMAVYLRSVAPRKGKGAIAINRNPPALGTAQGDASSLAAENADRLGGRIFEGACASCHGWDGSGLQTSMAGLKGLRGVNDPEGTNALQVILSGHDFMTKQGRVAMPRYSRGYSDAEIAAVTNYVIGRFGGKDGKVTAARAAEARRTM